MGRDQPQETASVSTAGDAEPAVDCQQRPQIRVTGQSVLDASNWKHVLLANTTPIAASSAAVAGVLAGFPFDSIKTRMQTHHYDSIIDCVRKTYASEGLSGYFRGIIPPLITVSIIKSFAFSVYEGTKLHLKHTFPAAQSDAKSRKWQLDLSGNSIASNTLLCTLSGATSGAFVAVFSCPLELVKVQRQLALVIANQQMQNSWLSAREVLRAKGIMGLYSGFSCHFARDTLGTAVYFGTYEFVKRSIATRSEGDGSQLYKTGPMVHFLAGGMCGVISWLIIFPTDLVKSILQKDVLSPNPGYRGVIDCVRRVYATNGLRGMYRGISVTLIRAFPLHSLNFVVYEGVRDYISKIASN
ncbi:mitochondrial carrier [Ramicandelaber brevisporus]|nr:mitochondrial carrier [Ramicandelaber brevisporus]